MNGKIDLPNLGIQDDCIRLKIKELFDDLDHKKLINRDDSNLMDPCFINMYKNDIMLLRSLINIHKNWKKINECIDINSDIVANTEFTRISINTFMFTLLESYEIIFKIFKSIIKDDFINSVTGLGIMLRKIDEKLHKNYKELFHTNVRNALAHFTFCDDTSETDVAITIKDGKNIFTMNFASLLNEALYINNVIECITKECDKRNIKYKSANN
ncbi:MAG: hypothetical protein MPJ08_01150 [Nitrosopumilus sp.]|nr:hypothetical protein [Nitrosopumilus sp.]